MRTRLKVPGSIAALLLAALLAAAAFSAGEVTYRSTERDGMPVGEVLIGDEVVIALLTSAGGISPGERAEVIAGRLQSALSESPTPEDVQVYAADSEIGVYSGDLLIATVTEGEATAQGTTVEALAWYWRDNIAAAIGPEPEPGEEPIPAEPIPTEPLPAEPAPAPAPEAIDWTGTAQKWVPIFSLETEGAYLGAAQVAGPTAQVAKVKGVAELRLDFRNIGRIYAYVPSTSLTRLDRVQGVSVWATGDVRLAEF